MGAACTAIVTRETRHHAVLAVEMVDLPHPGRPPAVARAGVGGDPSPRAGLRKLVSLEVPIAANPSLWTCATVASVASISASAA